MFIMVEYIAPTMFFTVDNITHSDQSSFMIRHIHTPLINLVFSFLLIPSEYGGVLYMLICCMVLTELACIQSSS